MKPLCNRGQSLTVLNIFSFDAILINPKVIFIYSYSIGVNSPFWNVGSDLREYIADLSLENDLKLGRQSFKKAVARRHLNALN